jgi:hypothetical protein
LIYLVDEDYPQLLGKASDDIDIALDNVMGLPFAEHVHEYANAHGIETGSVGKVASNPDQSKHLETANLRVYERDIDFVNLRSEEYASNSRIPTEVVSCPAQAFNSRIPQLSSTQDFWYAIAGRTSTRYHDQCSVL